ncbi:DUF4236 domain-containing protein [Propionibacterium freudenreichii]|uniref:DUF4236 domain-containing protein n=1 Tax=Propionibacterium freudenreichii TaxID=1744 RepID=UPI002A0ABE16|nr:DUF4236 domain-containing protein [Propionibacterium freudenreichii]MDK9321060.1 DUF4236 domain-containing protein [Propionibacterium freudenreichii]MDK9323467.1 DUF4236 domain-containing protein [Propionibacterium freudenreichii]MDK9339210.1 DUF4236 domain-containing protein [Propionibacterium freudenreichii]
MALRFRKRIRLGKHAWVNLSKSGPSLSAKAGPFTLNSKGKATTHLGPGLSYQSDIPTPATGAGTSKTRKGEGAFGMTSKKSPEQRRWVLDPPKRLVTTLWAIALVITVVATIEWIARGGAAGIVPAIGVVACLTFFLSARAFAKAWSHRSVNSHEASIQGRKGQEVSLTSGGDVKASKQHGARRRAVERMPRWA